MHHVCLKKHSWRRRDAETSTFVKVFLQLRSVTAVTELIDDLPNKLLLAVVGWLQVG